MGDRLRRNTQEKFNIKSEITKISIITASFNSSKTIERTILSVLNQKFKSVEHIVIDAASTDETIEILKRYESDTLKWISEQDTGIYDAWNKGLNLAKGEWICFIGSDDILSPEAFPAYFAFLDKAQNSDIEFISGKVELVRNHQVLRVVGKPWDWHTLTRSMQIAHVAALHRKSLFSKNGIFDLSYRICGDYEFLLRCGPSLKTAFINCIVAQMDVGGVSNENMKVFKEAERAKVTKAFRNRYSARLERLLATFKWMLRRRFMY